ncbi:MAG TPA: glutaredoxin family protein [Actinomycetaceae bacterium]|nr:glutaredoxin family protein [Actinomycetaceae bacterium]
MALPRVILFSRTDCHLCDAARGVVLAETERAGAAWREVDVDTDPALQARYGEYVPVVEVDGIVQGYWQIDPERLRAALA